MNKGLGIDKTQALIDAGLHIEDPTQLANLAQQIPEGVSLIKVIQSYDTKKTTKQKVSCAHCKHPKNHHRGLVVQLSNGQLILIGHYCGKEVFGEDVWNRANNQLKKAQKKAWYEARLQPALKSIDELLHVAQEWKTRANKIGEFLEKIKKTFPALYNSISAAQLLHEGKLQHEETKYVYVQDAHGQGKKVPKVESKIYCRIPANRLFLGETPAHYIDRCIKNLRAAKVIFEKPKLSEANIEEAFLLIQKARQEATQAEKVHTQSLKIFDVELWENIKTWAKKAKVGGNDRWYFKSNSRTLSLPSAYYHDDPTKLQIPTCDSNDEPLLYRMSNLWPN